VLFIHFIIIGILGISVQNLFSIYFVRRNCIDGGALKASAKKCKFSVCLVPNGSWTDGSAICKNSIQIERSIRAFFTTRTDSTFNGLFVLSCGRRKKERERRNLTQLKRGLFYEQQQQQLSWNDLTAEQLRP
jgi:hypothetical protein